MCVHVCFHQQGLVLKIYIEGRDMPYDGIVHGGIDKRGGICRIRGVAAIEQGRPRASHGEKLAVAPLAHEELEGVR